MKVYSWKTLTLTVVVGGWLLVSSIKEFAAGEMSAVLKIPLCIILILSGLYASLSKQGYEADRENAARTRAAYRRKFGALAPAAPWLWLAPLLLAVLLAEFCPVTNALRCVLAVLFLLGIGWMLWDRHWLAKTLEAEEKTEK